MYISTILLQSSSLLILRQIIVISHLNICHVYEAFRLLCVIVRYSLSPLFHNPGQHRAEPNWQSFCGHWWVQDTYILTERSTVPIPQKTSTYFPVTMWHWLATSMFNQLCLHKGKFQRRKNISLFCSSPGNFIRTGKVPFVSIEILSVHQETFLLWTESTVCMVNILVKLFVTLLHAFLMLFVLHCLKMFIKSLW